MQSAIISPAEALTRLMEGNRRYSQDQAEHPRQSGERRAQVLLAPHPIAALLSCADSRVPPEICFDQGIGDLFVIRTAGNIIDEVVLGSLEFGATVFGTPLIMVLGHTLCGAVKATLDGGETPGHIGSIVSAIQPAVALSAGQPGDPLLNATTANVRRMVAAIQNASPILAERIALGQLRVAGAVYHLDSGVVELL